MTARRERLLATFNGAHVEVQCDTGWLAEALRARLAHLTATTPVPHIVLRAILSELQPSWIEVRDSTGRCERGSLEHAIYHARKWITDAFVTAHPHLTWLHAAAASIDGRALLLAGPAGAGKSTLLMELIERAWLLVADDVVALRENRREVLPLPFSPELRASRRGPEEEWRDFLVRPKALATVAPDRVASAPAVVAAIVFPEYAAGVARPVLAPMTVVSATQALASQWQSAGHGRGQMIGALFDLARQVRCYRLQYADPAAAAVELTSLRAA